VLQIPKFVQRMRQNKTNFAIRTLAAVAEAVDPM